MFPFWEPVIEPMLRAAEVQTLVEIGALRGEHTRRIIDGLGPDTVLHVIDPAPGFDPADDERRYPDRYVFHRRLSVDVLGDLPPMDAALIDGDHNWYTVINELRLLQGVADAHQALLPVLVLHDVAWPYGRRDLYYDPETIPPEHRQPHRRAGMRPGRSELLADGGMSAGHWNAEREGGPCNGVMTALEDFLAELGRPVRTVVLPLYFGLAIVVEEERLRRQPQLAAELDRIEGAATRRTLIELGEDLRLRAVINNHTTAARLQAQLDRLANRYVDAVLLRLAPDGDADLVALRAALDQMAEQAVVGDVVLAVAGAAAPRAAALAGAWLAARDDEARHVWVVATDEPSALAQRSTALHDELNLPIERRHVVDATHGLSALPPDIAVLAADLGEAERNRAVLRAARARLSVDAVAIAATSI